LERGSMFGKKTSLNGKRFPKTAGISDGRGIGGPDHRKKNLPSAHNWKLLHNQMRSGTISREGSKLLKKRRGGTTGGRYVTGKGKQSVTEETGKNSVSGWVWKEAIYFLRKKDMLSIA